VTKGSDEGVHIVGVGKTPYETGTDRPVLRVLTQAVVAGSVLYIRDVLKESRHLAHQNIASVQDDDFGSVRVQGVALEFSNTPSEVRLSGRALGADDAEVFKHLLGLTAVQFQAIGQEVII